MGWAKVAPADTEKNCLSKPAGRVSTFLSDSSTFLGSGLQMDLLSSTSLMPPVAFPTSRANAAVLSSAWVSNFASTSSMGAVSSSRSPALSTGSCSVAITGLTTGRVSSSSFA